MNINKYLLNGLHQVKFWALELEYILYIFPGWIAKQKCQNGNCGACLYKSELPRVAGAG